MGVDQARHQRAAAAVDCSRSIRRREIAGRQRLDPPGLDEQAKSAPEPAGLAVEEKEIGENDGRGNALRLRAARKAEGGQRCADASDEAPPADLAVDPPRDRADFRSAAATAGMLDRSVIGWRA